MQKQTEVPHLTFAGTGVANQQQVAVTSDAACDIALLVLQVKGHAANQRQQDGLQKNRSLIESFAASAT